MSERKTVADFPELLAQWDWEANGDLRPEDVSSGSHRPHCGWDDGLSLRRHP